MFLEQQVKIFQNVTVLLYFGSKCRLGVEETSLKYRKKSYGSNKTKKGLSIKTIRVILH